MHIRTKRAFYLLIIYFQSHCFIIFALLVSQYLYDSQHFPKIVRGKFGACLRLRVYSSDDKDMPSHYYL